MRTPTQAETDSIEKIIDSTSLEYVLEAIGEICFAKSSHIRENWQDTYAAKLWERAGQRVHSFANTKTVMEVSR